MAQGLQLLPAQRPKIQKPNEAFTCLDWLGPKGLSCQSSNLLTSVPTQSSHNVTLRWTPDKFLGALDLALMDVVL